MVVSHILSNRTFVMLILTPEFYFNFKVGPWGGGSLKLMAWGPCLPGGFHHTRGGFNPSLGPEGGLKS